MELLSVIREAFLANDAALKVKDRLTALALMWLLLTLLLIGVLNLVCATVHS